MFVHFRLSGEFTREIDSDVAAAVAAVMSPTDRSLAEVQA